MTTISKNVNDDSIDAVVQLIFLKILIKVTPSGHAHFGITL